jgi:hypothetical protein
VWAASGAALLVERRRALNLGARAIVAVLRDQVDVVMSWLGRMMTSFICASDKHVIYGDTRELFRTSYYSSASIFHITSSSRVRTYSK